MNEPTGREPGADPVLEVVREDDSIVVRLGGELDLFNAPRLRARLVALADEQPARLVVDLGEVEFLDSTGLGVLIEARTRLANRNAFSLAAPGLETHRALQISGLDQHLAVHRSVSEALAAPLG